MTISRIVSTLVIACHVAALAACAQSPARVESRKANSASARPSVAPQPSATAEPDAVPAAAAQDAASAEYRLGPGDVVKITVYGNTDLATETEVSQGGKISFPLVGEVAVAGMTRGEAEKAIADSLGKGGFVPNAYVNMLISQYRSQQVSVVGEVNKPGNYPLSKTATIPELIAMAGGITTKGSNVVTVIQKDASGRTVRQQIDIRSVLADGSPIRLGYDDVVYVPPMPVFYIYGEVRQPGAYTLAPEMTVRQALAQGGGLTVRGTENGIRIERKGKGSGTVTLRPRLDDRLHPNDVVQVPESWF